MTRRAAGRLERSLYWLGAPLRWALIGAIRVYQRMLSPLIPFHCRFTPTCSSYAIEAVRQHGLLRGGLLALWRILRCQPFCRGGEDPVPTGPRGRAEG